MAVLGKIEGTATLIVGGEECGEVDCGIIVSRDRGIVAGCGRIEGDGEALMAALNAGEAELRLIGNKPFKINVRTVHIAQRSADIETSGPIPGF